MDTHRCRGSDLPQQQGPIPGRQSHPRRSADLLSLVQCQVRRSQGALTWICPHKNLGLESIIHEGNAIAVALSTTNDEATRKWWPHEFRAVQRITISSHLQMELTVTNSGAAPFTFQEALHTYYRVGNVREARLVGLDDVSYLDNTEGYAKKPNMATTPSTQRIDNAYLNTEADLVLIDPTLKRRIHIGKQNSHNTVVWNPWAELAGGMADLGDEWPHFLCVEAANIRANAVTLQPGEQHTMTANIRVERLDQ